MRGRRCFSLFLLYRHIGCFIFCNNFFLLCRRFLLYSDFFLHGRFLPQHVFCRERINRRFYALANLLHSSNVNASSLLFKPRRAVECLRKRIAHSR